MMTQIEHHLSPEILMAYAAGTLPEAFSLVVATHVSLCDECRAELAGYEALGGSVLETCGIAEMSDDSLEATLARIAGRAPEPRPVRSPRSEGIFPTPLRDYLGGDLEAVHWTRAGGGVRQAILTTARGATARLLHIPGGVAVPDHGHRGTELTLVLQGAFLDGDMRFGRGDVEIADEHVDHQPVAEMGADCICLAATDASLRFNTFAPRLLQPFLRI